MQVQFGAMIPIGSVVYNGKEKSRLAREPHGWGQAMIRDMQDPASPHRDDYIQMIRKLDPAFKGPNDILLLAYRQADGYGSDVTRSYFVTGPELRKSRGLFVRVVSKLAGEGAMKPVTDWRKLWADIRKKGTDVLAPIAKFEGVHEVAENEVLEALERDPKSTILPPISLQETHCISAIAPHTLD